MSTLKFVVICGMLFAFITGVIITQVVSLVADNRIDFAISQSIVAGIYLIGFLVSLHYIFILRKSKQVKGVSK